MSNDAYSVGDRVDSQGLTLTQKISGVTKLSPKIIKVIAGGALLLFMLLMYAVDSADSVDTPTKTSDDKKSDGKEGKSSAATLPLSLTEEVSDGVPAATFANGSKGPTPLFGKDGQPINAGTPLVPAVGNTTAALPTEGGAAPSMDKAEITLAEKRKSARDRAMESNGSVSGFSSEVVSAAAPPITPPANGNLDALNAAQSKPADAEQDDQNKQVRKEKFLKGAAADSDDGYLVSLKKPQITPYEIKAGSIIPGVLKSAINSDLPGLIRGIVSEDVYDTSTGKYILIPRGSTIVGTYDSQIAYGQRRLLAVWTKLIFPDGSTLSLKGMPAADQEGSAGLSGEVDNHYMRLFGAALATSVISAGYQMSQGAQSVVGSVAQTPGQTMASSLGQQLGQAGTAITSKNLSIQPTLTNPVAQRFYVNVTKDIVFQKPY